MISDKECDGMVCPECGSENIGLASWGLWWCDDCDARSPEAKPLPPPSHVIINAAAAVACYAFAFWLGLIIIQGSITASWFLMIWVVFFGFLGSLATFWLVRWFGQRSFGEDA